MKKFKKGFVTGIKKEEEKKQEQIKLHKKHHIVDDGVLVVEKDNMTKFTIRSLVGLVRLVATIILCLLAAIGLLTMIYPEVRSEFLAIGLQIYTEARTLMGI
ncbi:MAG: hypothetical protein RR869_08690 [Lachnospiraceae bacterium]